MNDLTGGSVASVPTRLGPLRVETAGAGPPAVLWHSLFADSTTWIWVRQPLAAERRLILIDGPAHGGNPPVPHRFTMNAARTSRAPVMPYMSMRCW